MDSTLLTTCLNRRIFNHEVTKIITSRGKSTKGWFYGLKLHEVCSENGLLESVYFTSGNANDSKTVEKLTEKMTGRFFADAGYLKKNGIF
ncbi:transposase [Treponema peruense]|uniref:Transposase n=1 Tax=Treponema peruense TaxID=2787628 RepID=A0A7T3RFG7_9SPIR|nr:transposase [Treponema peruense]QQA02138.1 transposase [Treponema peruense]